MRSDAMATLALLVACAPLFAAGTGSGAGCWTAATNSPAVGREEPAPLLSSRLGTIGCQPLAAGDWRLMTEDRSMLVRTCGLETLNIPELAPPAARPLRLPSLGGPTLTLTSPDALPALRDDARQENQEDTLRLFRSHW